MIVQELVAKLGLNVDEQSFSRITQALTGAKTALLGLGAAAGAALVGVVAIVKSTADAGDEVGKLSAQTNMATDAVQELQFAAALSYTSAETLTAGMRSLARTAYEASQGGKEAAEAFRVVGVRATDGQGKLRTTDDLLMAIASRFKDMDGDATKKTALAMRLFGRSGAELVPMLNKGAEGLAELRKRAHELGVVLDAETIAASGDFDVSVKELQYSLTGLRNAIGGPLIRPLTEAIKAFTDWLQVNRKVIALKFENTINAIGAAAKWARDNFYLLKWAVLSVVVAWGLHALAIAANTIGLASMLSWYVALAVAAVVAAVKAAVAWMAAAAPFILLGALIVLLADELYNFVTGGETMLGRLIKWLDKFDPSDSPLINLFKSAYSLMFDITDPKKWERLGRAILTVLDPLIEWFSSWAQPLWESFKEWGRKAIDWVAAKLKAIVAPFEKFGSWLGEKLGTNNKTGATPEMRAEAAAIDASVGEWVAGLQSPPPFSPGASSPAASVSNSSMSSSAVTDARTQSIAISVTVPPGTDAQGVGDVVKESARELLENELSSSYVAVSSP